MYGFVKMLAFLLQSIVLSSGSTRRVAVNTVEVQKLQERRRRLGKKRHVSAWKILTPLQVV